MKCVICVASFFPSRESIVPGVVNMQGDGFRAAFDTFIPARVVFTVLPSCPFLLVYSPFWQVAVSWPPVRQATRKKE